MDPWIEEPERVLLHGVDCTAQCVVFLLLDLFLSLVYVHDDVRHGNTWFDDPFGFEQLYTCHELKVIKGSINCFRLHSSYCQFMFGGHGVVRF